MRTIAQSSYCPSRTCCRPAMREMVALFFLSPCAPPVPSLPCLCVQASPLSHHPQCTPAPHVRTRAAPLSRRVSVSTVVQTAPRRLPHPRIHRRTTATTWARGLSPPRQIARRAPPSAIVGAYPTARLHQERQGGLVRPRRQTTHMLCACCKDHSTWTALCCTQGQDETACH